MLRLVKPAAAGQGSGPSRARGKRFSTLTPLQKQHLRAALKNLHRTYGTWRSLGEAMGIAEGTLKNIAKGHSGGSYAAAVLAAKAGGVSVPRDAQRADATSSALTGRRSARQA